MSTVEVPLTRGFVSLIDAEDSERVLRHKWTYHSQGYAYRQVSRGGVCETIMLHRFIMGLPSGEGRAGRYVDHKDRDRLNNRRSNLRVCTNRQNQQACAGRGSKTGFKGVISHPERDGYIRPRPYQARIKVSGKYLSLGYFVSAEEAARAYDVAAKEYFGEFARFNFSNQ